MLPWPVEGSERPPVAGSAKVWGPWSCLAEAAAGPRLTCRSVVLAMDLHEVLLHLTSQALFGREVLHIQEDDKLVLVGST